MPNHKQSSFSDYSISEISLSYLKDLFSSRSEALAESALSYQPSHLQFLEEYFGWKPRHILVTQNGRPKLFMPGFEARPHLPNWLKFVPNSLVKTIQSMPNQIPGGFLQLESTSKAELPRMLIDTIKYLKETYGTGFVRVFDIVFSDDVSPLSSPLALGDQISNRLDVHQWGFWPSVRGVTSLQEIWHKRLTDSARRAVRFAERAGLRIDTSYLDEKYSLFYDLYQSHYLRLNGKPTTRGIEYFEKLSKSLGNQLILMTAYVEKEPLAALLFSVVNRCYTNMLFPSKPDSHKYKANNYLVWMSLMYAWEKGARVFDYGRTSLDDKSNLAFKRYMGGYPYRIMQCEYRSARASLFQRLFKMH